MTNPSFELESVDTLAAAATGPPGSRQFFLLARGSGAVVTLACEKFHIQGLVTRARQLLEAQEMEEPPLVPGRRSPVPAVGEADWAIAELGLGYHEAKARFVIVARERPEEEGETTEEGSEAASARLWVTPRQVRDFATQAEEVLAGGRPTCNYCGLPMDPGGHPCPAANGSRPIF